MWPPSRQMGHWAQPTRKSKTNRMAAVVSKRHAEAMVFVVPPATSPHAFLSLFPKLPSPFPLSRMTKKTTGHGQATRSTHCALHFIIWDSQKKATLLRTGSAVRPGGVHDHRCLPLADSFDRPRGRCLLYLGTPPSWEPFPTEAQVLGLPENHRALYLRFFFLKESSDFFTQYELALEAKAQITGQKCLAQAALAS